MPRFAYSWGDGNDGVSRMYPDGYIEAATAFEAIAELVKEGSPEADTIDGEDEDASAVWYEIDGAPALNGAAAGILEVWKDEDEE